MDLFINAIRYCEDGLDKAIENNDDLDIIQAWRSELARWKANFLHYYQLCKCN